MAFECRSFLQAYTLIECLEREMFDERYAVYLYIIDLRTELDRLGFLASDDGTYIMTVNADDAVTDFPPFKAFNEGIRLKEASALKSHITRSQE